MATLSPALPGKARKRFPFPTLMGFTLQSFVPDTRSKLSFRKLLPLLRFFVRPFGLTPALQRFSLVDQRYSFWPGFFTAGPSPCSPEVSSFGSVSAEPLRKHFPLSIPSRPSKEPQGLSFRRPTYIPQRGRRTRLTFSTDGLCRFFQGKNIAAYFFSSGAGSLYRDNVLPLRDTFHLSLVGKW